MKTGSDCVSLYFTSPGRVEVRASPRPVPGPGQVLVQAQLSAISPGTEMLIYRGQFPANLPLDANLASLSGSFTYPLQYGYSMVGEVIELGAGVDTAWLERQVFAFQPHASHFLAQPADLFPLPTGFSAEDSVFLPNMETAVNFVMDGAPLIGERVVIFGQGVVGLLTTALLRQFPLSRLVTLDRYPLRRKFSIEMGAHASLDPEKALKPGQDGLPFAQAHYPQDADLVYELSGQPQALDLALAVTGFAGRVIIGSWYGEKRANLDLGGAFHRSRIRLISSQVSSLAPELTGRWTKARRFEVAWESLRGAQPGRLITHRFPIQQAAAAYQLIDEQPDKTVQVVLTYGSDE